MGKGECSTEMLTTKLHCNEVKVSAPGKVILHGDHSVVYGKLAIAASLGLRTNLTLKEIANNQSLLGLNCVNIGLNITYSIEEIKTKILTNGLPLLPQFKLFNIEHPEYIDTNVLLERIELFLASKDGLDVDKKNSVMICLYLFCVILCPSGLALSGMEMVAKTELKVGAGMGSSASFAVSIVAAFFEYIKMRYRSNTILAPDSYKSLTLNKAKIFTEHELKLISTWAFHAEKITHGNPSGIDNSTCTFGSVVEFRRNVNPKPLHLQHKLTALLIDTMVPRNTKALVGKVAAKRDRFPPIIENTLNSMEDISKSAVDCLKKLSDITATKSDYKLEDFKEQYDLLGTLVDMNQNMLRILGVSHQSIDHICWILSKYGLHGKLTGAGGGGYVLAIIPFYVEKGTLENVQQTLKQEKYSVSLLVLGGEGVTVH